VSTWDDLLTVTHPGTEVEIGADRWLVMRRSYTPGRYSAEDCDNTMTITVELVRSGSPADPRAIQPTPPREDPAP
jgi:hypothetical protein